MYSTFELDELFQILNSIKGFKLDNHNGATQHGGPTEMCIHLGSKYVAFILFVESIDSTYKVQTYTSEVVVQY